MGYTVEAVAALTHEINRAYCNVIGDHSQAVWSLAPEWQKESAIAGVKFHLENPNATPEDSHKSWLRQKEADGWRYGFTKDEVKKTHPCMVDYDDLPVAQRVKDYLFSAIVNAYRNDITA